MNMTKIIVVCTVLAVSSTLTMQAQQAGGPAVPGEGGRGITIYETGRLGQTLALRRPLETKVVKGMPYSAEIVAESIQTLGDGNRIVQRSTGRVYRDGEGRVRREEDRPSASPSISITDPVTDMSITLDTASRTARETPGLNFVTLPRTYFDAFTQGTRAYTFVADGAAAGGARPGARGGAARGGVAARDEQVEEQLPKRSIEGVPVSGVRRTTTIAKGAIGNEQPIKIVSEEWTSADLQVLVMTDFNDPRAGRSTYRLLKIMRGEPDATLFKAPADYTVQRAVGRGGRGRGGGGGGGAVRQ